MVLYISYYLYAPMSELQLKWRLMSGFYTHSLLPESPRWLIARKRYAEAKTIFENMARVNGVVLPAHLLEIPEEATSVKQQEAELEVAPTAENENIVAVFKTPCLLKRLLILCLAWSVRAVAKLVVSSLIASISLLSYDQGCLRICATTVWRTLRPTWPVTSFSTTSW